MCNYRMDIKGKISLSDYSNIFDYINIVDVCDRFMIYMESLDDDNIGIICSMLKDNNFNIKNQGYDNQGIYYINAKKIVYVSCDPSTLGRDLKVLEENGYKTLEVQPVDMFPNTAHIENVALLIKK